MLSRIFMRIIIRRDIPLHRKRNFMNKKDLPPPESFVEWREIIRAQGINDAERAEATGLTKATVLAWLRKPPQSVIYFALLPDPVRNALTSAIRKTVRKTPPARRAEA